MSFMAPSTAIIYYSSDDDAMLSSAFTIISFSHWETDKIGHETTLLRCSYSNNRGFLCCMLYVVLLVYAFSSVRLRSSFFKDQIIFFRDSQTGRFI